MPHRPLGSGIKTIIVDEALAIAKDGDELMIVEVRRGAEVLAREDAAVACKTGTVVSSPLLVPTTIAVRAANQSRIARLEQCGLILREEFDKRLQVLEVPIALKGTDPARWLEAVVNRESEIGEALGDAALEHAVATEELVTRILRSEAARDAATRKVDVNQLRSGAGDE